MAAAMGGPRHEAEAWRLRIWAMQHFRQKRRSDGTAFLPTKSGKSSIFRTFSDGFGAFSVDESGQEDCFDEPTEAT